jgi:hypothetical protein
VRRTVASDERPDRRVAVRDLDRERRAQPIGGVHIGRLRVPLGSEDDQATSRTEQRRVHDRLPGGGEPGIREPLPQARLGQRSLTAHGRLNRGQHRLGVRVDAELTQPAERAGRGGLDQRVEPGEVVRGDKVQRAARTPAAHHGPRIPRRRQILGGEADRARPQRERERRGLLGLDGEHVPHQPGNVAGLKAVEPLRREPGCPYLFRHEGQYYVSSRLRILPVAVIGRESRNSISLGYL